MCIYTHIIQTIEKLVGQKNFKKKEGGGIAVKAECHFGHARHWFVSPDVERVDQRKFLLCLLVYVGMKT